MLRLKGEPDDSMADGEHDDPRSDAFEETPGDHPAFESRSLPDDGHGFDEGLEDDEREGRWRLLSDTSGLAIAAASFVPTFLVVFFGVPYLLGEPSLATTPSPSPAVATAPVLEPEPPWSLSNSLAEALRGGPLERLVGPPTDAPAPLPSPSTTTPPQVAAKAPEATAPGSKAPEPPAAAPATSAATPAPATPATPPAAATVPDPEKRHAADAVTRETRVAGAAADQMHSRDQLGEPMPGAGGSGLQGSSGADAAPSLPPAQRVPEPERKVTTSKPVTEPRTTPARRPVAATPDPPRAQSESRKSSGDWTPAAAFADREAATRLASSIERQGYPVEIRQEASSTRPWVVWIGSQPSGGGRRR
ncbi:MAG TPA: hypothetical protein VF653_02835 [Methylomirabilota bacterium]